MTVDNFIMSPKIDFAFKELMRNEIDCIAEYKSA